MKNIGLYEYVYDFSVDYSNGNTSNITNIHKYLMKKYCIWILYKCLNSLSKRLLFRYWYCFVGSLAAGKVIKCVLSKNNQQCMIRITLIDGNLDGLHYYPFVISMNSCDESCNTAEDPFGRIFASNKMEDLNLKVFNMIKGINESKTLAKRISCECRC